MFKQLPLSLILLLSLTGSINSRFLQVPTNTTNKSQTLVTSLPPKKATYNATSSCGECILNGFVFCINGPEQYSGAKPLKSICCENATNCKEASNATWTCSSKYANSPSIVDKLRVCPFDANQCGQQQLEVDNLGDTQCVRTNIIKKGTACLYNVTSKCGVPAFRLNDTTSTIFSETLMVGNTSISTAPVQKGPVCTRAVDQQCICKSYQSGANITMYNCDCSNKQSITLSPSSCKQCTTLTDMQNNTIQMCVCGVPQPIQSYVDQVCKCQTVTNLITKSTSLSCKDCGIGAVSLESSSCNCVNAFDAKTNTTYQSCVCKDVPQCQDPSSFVSMASPILVAPTCLTSYPCSCAAINSKNLSSPSQSLSCTCTNPSTSLTAQITTNASSCFQCSTKINSNSTWSQACNCCLPSEFVRSSLIGPVICLAPNAIKETCNCTNSTIGNTTVTSVTCDCIHPTSNVPARILYNGNAPCDCPNINFGTKQCKCCVSYDTQASQMQPICAKNSSIQYSQCFNQGNLTKLCSINSTFFGMTFNNVTVNNTNCYCNPFANSKFLFQACNCCVSDSQYQGLQQNCPSDKTSSACKCAASNITGAPLTCNCSNSYYFNSISQNVTLNQKACACFNATGNQTGLNCQCCAAQSDLFKQPTCNQNQTFVKCNACLNVTDKFTKKISLVCNCKGQSIFDLSSPVSIDSLNISNNTCGCSTQYPGYGIESTIFGEISKTHCNCCVSKSTWQPALPTCNTGLNSLKCSCKNESSIVFETKNLWKIVNVTNNYTCQKTGCSGEICSNSSMITSCKWNNQFSCYSTATCEYQVASQTCGWSNSTNLTTCLVKPPLAISYLYQNRTNITSTVKIITTQANQTYTEQYNRTVYTWNCGCTNSRYANLIIKKAQVTPSTCGCVAIANSTVQNCTCCHDEKSFDDSYLSTLTCAANLTNSDCQCARGNNTCSCTPINSGISYTSIDVSKQTCICANTTDVQKTCKCCLPQNKTLLIPIAPQCSALSTSQSCICKQQISLETGNPVLSCNCNTTQTNVVLVNATAKTNATNVTVINMITSYQVMTPQQCNCLNIVNGSNTQTLCNCCVQNALICPANVTAAVQNCSCTGNGISTLFKTPITCSCTRSDNNIMGTFQLDQSNCTCNSANNKCSCCISKPQFATQIPVLVCPDNSYKQQNCSTNSSNSTAVSQIWSCMRSDNNITGSFSMSPMNCLCAAPSINTAKNCEAQLCDIQGQFCLVGTPGAMGRNWICPGKGKQWNVHYGNLTATPICQCCVSTTQVATQIPRAKCVANQTSQYCSCSNLSYNQTIVNSTTNKTTMVLKTVQNCICSQPAYLMQKSFNFTQNQCLCLGTTKCECCLTPDQISSQIPSLQCQATEIAQTGCRCQNGVSNALMNRMDYTCDCGIKYQNVSYSVNKLNTASNQCMCNTTTCGCCISDSAVMQVTEKQCSASQFRSTCNSCVSYISNKKTNETSNNCSSCATTTNQGYVLLNQTYNSINTSACLCRTPTNCTCCLATLPATNLSPICGASARIPLQNCQCNKVTTNTSSYLDCACTNTSAGIDTFFNNNALSNCSCQNVARPTGQRPLQCSCCANSSQVAVPTPTCPANSSVEICSCVNGTNSLNCNCMYKDTSTVIQQLNMNNSMCGCPSNNANIKQCGCCVAVQQYRDAIIPSCQKGHHLSVCKCINITTTVNKIQVIQLNCNCSANITTSQKVVNNNLIVNQNRCGCFKDEFGIQQCNCCLNKEELTVYPNFYTQVCLANQLQANCTSPADASVMKNFSCKIKNSVATYDIPSVQIFQRDCNCYNVTEGNLTTQQCSCCASQAVINLQAPICNITASTQQQCLCTNWLGNGTLCDCTRKIGNVQQTIKGITNLSQKDCSQCLNQTVGLININNCSCCVPNPLPTLCQKLAQPSMNNLNCKCGYIVVNGKSTFSCDCTAVVNATTTVTQVGMLLNETQSCCCVQKTDPLTRQGFYGCNCTIPAVQFPQNCKCQPDNQNKNSTKVNCVCSDCNKVSTPQTLPLSQCLCAPFPIPKPAVYINNTSNNSSVNTTNKTVNTTNSTISQQSVNTTGKANTTNSTSNSSVTPPSNTNGTKSNSTATNATSGSNATVTGTKSNATNSTTGSNATVNGTKTNVTNSTTGSNATVNGTKTNATNATTGTNATVNGTKTNATNATTGTNATVNGTKTNATNATTGTNATVNGTKTNATNATTGTNATVNGTKSNSTNATTASNVTNGTKTNTTVVQPGTNVTGNSSSKPNSTNATIGSNTTVNGTKTNSTNATTASNATKTNTTVPANQTSSSNSTNGTKPNSTVQVNVTNGTKPNNTVPANQTLPSNSTNGTKPNSTVQGNFTNGTKSNSTVPANQTQPSNSTNGTKPNNTSSGNATNGTQSSTVLEEFNTFAQCSCQVEFASLCAPVDIMKPVNVTEGTCDASNLPKPLAVAVNAGCKYQYQYLVAVVAQNKDASVLLTLQAYQISAPPIINSLQSSQTDMFGQYVRMSFATIAVLLASVFLFY